jgi:hypothetical protein
MNARGAVRVWLALLFCVVQGLMAFTAVRAEPIDPARSASARALFEEGVGHADRDEWADAADAFRRALSLRDSQVIRYNLASALVELGKLVEASELLHTVQADTRVDAALTQQAVDKLAEVKPRIARLTIHVEAALPDLIVELDDGVLTLSQLDVPLTVDPGKHVVRERLGGALIDEQTAEFMEGGSGLITLHAPAPQPESVFAAPTPAPLPTPALMPAETARLAVAEPVPSAPHPLRDGAPEKPSRKKLWWGIAVGGVGAIAFVTLVALFVPRHHSNQSSAARGDFDPPSVSVRVPQ